VAAWIIRETLRQADADIMQPQECRRLLARMAMGSGSGVMAIVASMRSASHMKTAARQFRLLDLEQLQQSDNGLSRMTLSDDHRDTGERQPQSGNRVMIEEDPFAQTVCCGLLQVDVVGNYRGTDAAFRMW